MRTWVLKICLVLRLMLRFRLTTIGKIELTLAGCFLGLGPGLFLYILWCVTYEWANHTPASNWFFITLGTIVGLAGTYGAVTCIKEVLYGLWRKIWSLATHRYHASFRS
ncbi:MAG: hypothetical protein A3H71_01940 [Candidatus Sungbacteria bacterium RIFCSPLOWO2_02_FULL_48_13b]|uniref:Uncharacterized protein n=2 Tax=Candidatus Sungiibacteriota TaxID=1817917 RepID=A0A1G2LGJ5_9BACT|nr:MAG: hypothetical protein A3C12_00360 [Candidatus Sungbacteria bacterium RIFCSPHIGHO2_02_FULL_49_20]OHA09921.1 MAG: hypothetical protein A3H71_01940 [Candidatus Sungbacteria bacterium RIFCSPLOWO2_02_FULL_48_13b]